MDSLLQFDGLTDRLSDPSYTDPNNNTNDEYRAVPLKDKYSLRPRSLRRAAEQGGEDAKAESKHKPHKQKQKPAPLSKYRRKTANARERNRMREINQAFETLRRVIPHMQVPQVPGTNEKLTKITTLRLAMKYISALSAALNNPEASTSSTPETSSDYGDLDCLLLESDGESLQLSDHSLLASPDFPESSLSPVDFGDPCLPALLHTDFSDHTLEPDFNEFFFADVAIKHEA
ncbi:hypothetical protein Zmor_010317 [Zophobas morio]|uniref:BHLH domain-containing protein n=1 Tax=Zophobas morio TaxID=2755281 RepID=A0AA38IQT3_9CUCU|nr:hypothetical protein Zmor_010317 [Zophobas morio]